MSEELGFAIQVVTEAGAVVLDFCRRRSEPIWTDRSHFKTAADDASEAIFRRLVAARYPNDTVWSEEGGRSQGTSSLIWVFDGVDGTIPMFRGITDHFAICLALCQGTRPIIGVVNAVKRQELYVAEAGHGARCNGQPIRVSTETEIGHVVMGIDSGKFSRDAHIPFIQRACQPDGIVAHLSSGCASVPLCLVASGVMHAYLATSLEAEDMAAAVCLVREAGGKVTNLEGKEWKLGDQGILAANPVLHQNLSAFFGIPTEAA